jgi:hypothetical protein
MKSSLKYLALVAGVTAFAAGSAYAIPTLWLTDGTTSVVVADGSALDTLPGLAGVVSWQGPIGNWYLNVSTGQAFPSLGTINQPEMDLNSVNSSNVGGTISIYFSADGFTGTGGTLKAQFGGTLDTGSVHYETMWSSSNTLFSADGGVLTNRFFNTSPYAGTDNGVFSPTGTYSLTQLVVISRTGQGTTSWDANLQALQVPDGGTTALLLGLGFIGMGLMTRRIKSVKKS